MRIGLLTLDLRLAGCTSLKEKRSRLKPLIVRLHREFNISVAEVDKLDVRQEALIACTIVSNDQRHTQRSLQQVSRWIEASWPDVTIIEEHLEII
jgi:uncharacterized protein